MTASQVPDTSTTLLRDVADSSHARWSVFYSRYQPMMRSYLKARFPSLNADDIIQETFAALAKILPDYQYAPEKNGAFHNFLTGVLRNKALCALDASRRQMALKERMRDMKTAVKYHRYNSIGCSGVSALVTVCSLCVGCSQEDRDDAISRTAGAARELNGGNGTPDVVREQRRVFFAARKWRQKRFVPYACDVTMTGQR